MVPRNRLQSKTERYYHADDIAKLDRNEIYVSPFDLNIEEGSIEVPFKPTVRFATPIVNHHGERIGFVIINLLGKAIIDFITEDDFTCDHTCELMLLNSSGYWLKGPVVENQMAFMFTDKQDISFAI